MTGDPRQPAIPDSDEIKQLIMDQAPVWEEQFAAGPGIVVGVADAATVIATYLAAAVPVLERALRDKIAAEIDVEALCIHARRAAKIARGADDLTDELGARYEKHRAAHATNPGPYDEGYLDALDVAEQLARDWP